MSSTWMTRLPHMSSKKWKREIGPLQLVSQVAQIRHTGEQVMHCWDKRNTALTLFKMIIPLPVFPQSIRGSFTCSPAWRLCTTWMASCKGPIVFIFFAVFDPIILEFLFMWTFLLKLIFDILHQDQVPSTDEQSWQRSRISSHRLTHKLRDSQGTRKYWMIITTSCTCVNCWMIIQKMQILDDNHKGTWKYWMIITTSCRGVNC